MSKRTFDDFDEFANDYREIHNQNIKLSGADSFYFAEMKIIILKTFEQNKSLKILDVGCGDGTTEIFIEKHFPNWVVSGIDVSEKSIAVAKQRNIANADFKLYDGSHIPFPDGHFDLIFIAGVLHHINFQLHHSIVAEMNRVLKTDGRLYLYEHNPLNPLTKYLVRTCVFDEDAKLLHNGYTKNLLSDNNLKVCNNNFIIFFPRKGLLSKLIFIEKYLKWLPLGGQYFIKAVKVG